MLQILIKFLTDRIKSKKKNDIEFSQKAILAMKTKLPELKKFVEDLFDPTTYMFEEFPEFLQDLYAVMPAARAQPAQCTSSPQARRAHGLLYPGPLLAITTL